MTASTEGSKRQSGKKVEMEVIDGTSTGPMAMADKAREADAEEGTLPAAPTFNSDFMDKVVKAKQTLNDIATERSELNARAQAVIAGLESEGLNKHAVRAAIKYDSMNPEQRENYDLSYAISRKALGQPLQDDLFVAAAKRDIEHHARAKAS